MCLDQNGQRRNFRKTQRGNGGSISGRVTEPEGPRSGEWDRVDGGEDLGRGHWRKEGNRTQGLGPRMVRVGVGETKIGQTVGRCYKEWDKKKDLGRRRKKTSD